MGTSSRKPKRKPLKVRTSTHWRAHQGGLFLGLVVEYRPIAIIGLRSCRA